MKAIENKIRSRLGDKLFSYFVRGSLVSMGVRFVGMAIAFASHVLLARLLGATAYGSYVIALGWAMVLAAVARLGLDYAALRFATVYREEERGGDLRGLMTFSLTAMLAISLLFLSISLLGKWAGEERLAEIPSAMLVGVAGLAFGTAMLGWYSALIRTMHRIFASQAYDQVLRPSIFVAGIAAVLFSGIRLDAVRAMLLTLASTLAALFFIAIQSRRLFGFARQQPASFAERRHWLSMGWAVMVMGLLQESLNQIEVVFFGLLADGASAARFSAATRLSSLVSFGLVAIITISGPMIASAFRRGNMVELARISRLNARFSFAFALVLVLVLALAGRSLLRLFGPSFEAAYPALLILLIGGLVNAFTGSVGYLLTMTGKHRVAMFIVGVTLTLSAVLNLLLIPRFGLVGGAIASTSSLCIWNLAMLVYVRLDLGIDASAIGFAPRQKSSRLA